ncbi:helix-turn-helix transcriptional regulator [Nannocystis radixulma]|uniref:Helix-turn-helix transcriptional regulator n=1 Tax=Nannocystis radixulma TaxID=2995305 RepID=A0ABT5B4W3_9BACT|nr:helix-turn-helix transcriptional regulator [Nannocystis radixulma]MDC0669148.1 helix-turn-helix transcriptional regulator [Nannocystis radixulma]
MRPRVTLAPLPVRTEYVACVADVAGVRYAEAVYPAGLVLREHAHEHPCITVVVDGAFEETAERRLRACPRGTLVVRPGGEPHANAVSARGVANLEIDLGPAAHRSDSLSAWLQRPTVLQHPRLVELSDAIRTQMRIRDAAQGLVLEGLTLELLGTALRIGATPDPGGPPRWLLAVRDALEAAFLAPPRVAELAADAGVHPVHLTRSFRAHFGASPGGYVRRLRLRWAAAELLRVPEKSVTRIALEAGFYDHGHFSRAFKAAIGTSPSSYRQRRAV